MPHVFVQIWDWFRGRKQTGSANYGDWRSMVEPEPGSVEAAAVDAAPAAPVEASAPALPLGSRFRQPTEEFAMTIGQSEELERLLKSIRPLPQGVMRVMQELNNADASASSVAEAIQCEPVMAASMVRLANSSAIGLRREVTSVPEAVAYLGFSTTKSLLLRFNVDALLPSSRPGKGYDTGKLWIHGMAVAQVAEELARRAGNTDSSMALTAGLLHDIGKLAINSQFPHLLEQLWIPGLDPNEGLLTRERRLFQADHAIIGFCLATEWKLPCELADIVRLHHTPYDLTADVPRDTRRVLYCVQIANQLVKYRHVYCEGMEIDEVPQRMTEELGLPDWARLMTDKAIQNMIDRTIVMNGGSTEPVAAAA